MVSPEIVDFIRLRDIAVLEVLFATGIRVHELCNITCDCYDSINYSLRILGKGQKERILYIVNDSVCAALRNYSKALKQTGYKSNYVFLNKYGSKLSTQAVRNIVKKYRNIVGIKKRITPHSFRHSFASLLLEEGVDIKYIQEFLGHSSITTTQIYLHISEKNARAVLLAKHPRNKLSI